MAIENPFVYEDMERSDISNMAEIVDNACKRIDGDWTDSRTWLKKLAHFYARRYCLLYRNPEFPWKDSCNIVLPVIDKFINQLKPPYYDITFGRQKLMSCMGLDDDGSKNAGNMELYLNSILGGHSLKYAQRDFYEQHAYFVEDVLQHGRGIWTVDYSFKTETVWRTIHYAEMPGVLGKLTGSPKLSDEQRQAVLSNQQMAQQLNPPDVMRAFNGFPVNPMTADVFRQVRPVIAGLVADLYDLDQGVKADQKAIAEVVNWIGAGWPEGQLRVKFRAVIHNSPILRAVSPGRLIVPRGVSDVQDAHRLTEILEINEHDFEQVATDNKWDERAVEEIMNGRSDEDEYVIPNELDSEIDDRLGQQATVYRGNLQSDSGDKVFKIARHWSRIDIDGDGRNELTCMYFHKRTKQVLSFKDNPFDGMNTMPYVQCMFEVTDPDYRASRGLGEIIDDADKYLTSSHRASINAKLIETSRGFFIRRESGLTENAFQWAPNMIVETDDPQRDVLPLAVPASSHAWDGEAQFLQVWIQSHIGDVSNDMTADSRLLEPRTKAEIDAREGARRRVLTMRGLSHVNALRKAFRMLMLAAKQYAPEKFYAQVTGSDAKGLRRPDINGEFDVVPLGSVADMDPSFRTQQAQMRFQFLVQTMPYFQADPRYRPQIAIAAKEVMDSFDLMSSRRLLPEATPEEMQQTMQEAQAEQQEAAMISEMAKRAMANAGVTPEEMEELLKRMENAMPQKALQIVIQQADMAKAKASALAAIQARSQAGAT